MCHGLITLALSITRLLHRGVAEPVSTCPWTFVGSRAGLLTGVIVASILTSAITVFGAVLHECGFADTVVAPLWTILIGIARPTAQVIVAYQSTSAVGVTGASRFERGFADSDVIQVARVAFPPTLGVSRTDLFAGTFATQLSATAGTTSLALHLECGFAGPVLAFRMFTVVVNRTLLFAELIATHLSARAPVIGGALIFERQFAEVIVAHTTWTLGTALATSAAEASVTFLSASHVASTVIVTPLLERRFAVITYNVTIQWTVVVIFTTHCAGIKLSTHLVIVAFIVTGAPLLESRFAGPRLAVPSTIGRFLTVHVADAVDTRQPTSALFLISALRTQRTYAVSLNMAPLSTLCTICTKL